MGDLIDGLLELSSVGRAELRKEPVDLTAMAEDVVHELAARDPGRRVEVDVQPDLVVYGDRRLLRIAFSNVLENAWKFSRHVPDARIDVRERPARGESVIEVHDNGAGFDMRSSRLLFTPFQRLHAEESFEGTGIGLALVRRIVTRHGGAVPPRATWVAAPPSRSGCRAPRTATVPSTAMTAIAAIARSR
jgi:signal transduction histidine kinase